MTILRSTIGDVAFLGMSCLLFWFMDIVLRFVSVERLLKILNGVASWSVAADRDTLTRRVTRAVWFVRAVDWRQRPECLPRSLAMYALLVIGGQTPVFTVGVKRYPFAAHAWVALDGRVVTDHESEHAGYQPLWQVSTGLTPSHSPDVSGQSQRQTVSSKANGAGGREQVPHDRPSASLSAGGTSGEPRARD